MVLELLTAPVTSLLMKSRLSAYRRTGGFWWCTPHKTCDKDQSFLCLALDGEDVRQSRHVEDVCHLVGGVVDDHVTFAQNGNLLR